MTPRAVLVGSMGAGKTTVGRLLAARLGVGFLDTDEEIERTAGKPVADIFVEDGEPAFRAQERDAVAAAVAGHDGVLALGGGAILDEGTRRLLAGHQVIFLKVGLSDAAERVGLGVSRPLLLGNVRGQIKRLLDERTPVYESVARHVVGTDGRTPAEIAEEILGLLGGQPGEALPDEALLDEVQPGDALPDDGPTSVIRVAGAAPYDVVVGHGVLDHVASILGESAQRVALVHAEPLAGIAERVADGLAAYEVLRVPLPDGEAAKTGAVAIEAWEALGAAGFTRSDVVVTVGGGATTDMGGFIAATWLRGVRVVHVPTTLLAMVDAAVGGKTGMNTGAGKNLVGSFHEPAGVVCDLDLLSTLPSAELVAGLGEVVKCGFIADPEILTVVDRDPAAVLDPASPALREVVERAIAVKAAVVAADLKETGGADGHPGREVLNYGHTMAHAVEKSTSYAVRHGEAVALGMVYVAELARRAGLIDDELASRHERALASVGLPVRWDGGSSGATFDDLVGVMRVDKKSRGSMLRFVVLHGLARPAILADPPEALLREAWEHLRSAS